MEMDPLPVSLYPYESIALALCPSAVALRRLSVRAARARVWTPEIEPRLVPRGVLCSTNILYSIVSRARLDQILCRI